MPLTVTLDPHGEDLVAAHLRSGRYHSPEEVVARALETLAEKEPLATAPKKTVAEPSPTSVNRARASRSAASR